MSRLVRARPWLGIELDEVSPLEKLVSVVGGTLAIVAVVTISRHLLGAEGAAVLIASMGASAVLLFAVPHGQMSQPWPVFGGHLGAALIGVACAELVSSPELAAACAVGVTIAWMHLARCIHPPGGATALTAVIGGEAVRSLGWSFVVQPVLVNVVTIVAVAVVFNLAFPWRRYPAHLARRRSAPSDPGVHDTSAGPEPVDEPSHEEVLAALRSLDSFIDITEEDLLRLHRILGRGGPG
jgi:CBS domain-containing membrane protein